MGKINNRFGRKLDKFFWFIILLLPLLTYFVMYFSTGTDIDFVSYTNSFRFPFVADIFTNVFAGVEFDNIVIVNYLSYACAVEIAHCLYDVVVFIPRLAHKFISKAVQDD